MIGALGSGKTQAYSTDLLTALKFNGAPMCTKSSATQIAVSAGQVWIANSGGSIKLSRRITSPITLTGADLDTGSMAAGYYYIYAVADAVGTTLTCKISASASAPTGLTNFELIGWFYNESASGSALDLTIGQIGNVKGGGRDVPNVPQILSATQVTGTTDTYVDDTQALLHFYTSGRPMIFVYHGKLGASANEHPYMKFAIDGSDVANSEIRNNVNSSTTTDIVAMTSIYYAQLAAGTHTIQGKFKSGSGGAVNYMNKRLLLALEL